MWGYFFVNILLAMFAVLTCSVAAIIAPLIFLWMLNTLFKLNIRYGFGEWFAAVLALSMFAVLAL